MSHRSDLEALGATEVAIQRYVHVVLLQKRLHTSKYFQNNTVHFYTCASVFAHLINSRIVTGFVERINSNGLKIKMYHAWIGVTGSCIIDPVPTDGTFDLTLINLRNKENAGRYIENHSKVLRRIFHRVKMRKEVFDLKSEIDSLFKENPITNIEIDDYLDGDT